MVLDFTIPNTRVWEDEQTNRKVTIRYCIVHYSSVFLLLIFTSVHLHTNQNQIYNMNETTSRSDFPILR